MHTGRALVCSKGDVAQTFKPSIFVHADAFVQSVEYRHFDSSTLDMPWNPFLTPLKASARIGTAQTAGVTSVIALFESRVVLQGGIATPFNLHS
jgi:hypothetical protein